MFLRVLLLYLLFATGQFQYALSQAVVQLLAAFLRTTALQPVIFLPCAPKAVCKERRACT